MITDTHSHLFWQSYDADRAAVLARARAAGISRMLVVGTDVTTSRQALALAQLEPDLFATAGIHPHEAATVTGEERQAIADLCRLDACLAVGETGLDYFKEYSPRTAQLELFRWHLELARTLDKPVIVHCRDAHDDTAKNIADFPGVRGVMHCYTMGTGELEPYLKAGFYISFSGVLTYPKNEANRSALRAVPLDRLLVETDCPFLAPDGRRGQRNEPAYLEEIVARAARERDLSAADFARITSANAAVLFRFPAAGA